ncbi:MAG: potassium/proton antiporter [Oceanicaulis sp.]
MENSDLVLLAASGLVLLAVAGAAATSRAGAPLLLVFLSLGMLAGVEGPGGFDFHAMDTAYLLGSLALALILFDGGLGTRVRGLKMVLRPSISLATIGVLITTGVTSLAARALFDLSWTEAVLMGAIVSSTDAAAVLALLGGRELRARPRVVATLEAESGFNDPVAVILVTACVEILVSGAVPDPLPLGGSILWALLAGAAVGVLGGRATALVRNRVALPESLHPIFAVAAAVFLFALAEAVGGSGFLAAYLAGVSVRANSHGPAREATERFSDGLAWLAQIGLFLMLGLLVAPSHAVSVALPALLLALVLIFVARPVAVFLCLAPEKFKPRETGFIAWMGLRGAVPIFLGTVPVLAGVEQANLFFSVAFAVVLVSLVVQGWTAGPVTRAFRIAPPQNARSGRQKLAGAAIAAAGAAALTAGVYVGAGLIEDTPRRVDPQTVAELRQTLSRAEPGAAPIIGALPADWSDLDAADRRDLFAELVSTLAATENARILEDRATVRRFIQFEAQGRTLSLADQAEREALARVYDGRYADLDDLLSRIDIVPPRLVTAQAALASGWGGSDGAQSRNALFGGAAHGSLSAAVADQMRLLNSHPDFQDFRDRRAALRAADADLDPVALAAELGPYASEPGYPDRLRAVMDGLPG